MKTNLAALMNLISEDEKQYTQICLSLKGHVFNTTIQELDGKTNIIENNKEDFDWEFNEINRLCQEISTFKNILYEKNNTFKLPDGRTIQTAIVDNTNLRNMRTTLKSLLNFRNNKKRVTEVNNSYFEVREINYNSEEIKNKIKELDKAIQKTDFEISKLNSIEFIVK